MNNENLKKLLKSVEVCKKPNRTECHGCPFDGEDNRYLPCAQRQYMLAKGLLRQMDEDVGLRYDLWPDPTTKDIVMELWNDGGDMIIGYKPNENYNQWLVGHVVNFDLRKLSIAIVGISTGVASEFHLDSYSRLIKWTGGPTAELICTEAAGSYKLGKRYWVCDGKLSVDQSEEGRPTTDGRFASLDDSFIKKHFVEYRGDRGARGANDKRYLNGWLICTKDNAFLSVSAGYRYRINYGNFKDNDGCIHQGFTDSMYDMHTLNSTWRFVYVPDEE